MASIGAPYGIDQTPITFLIGSCRLYSNHCVYNQITFDILYQPCRLEVDSAEGVRTTPKATEQFPCLDADAALPAG